MFDEIASRYYEKNYGTFSKSDMDLPMFPFYLDKELREQTDNFGQLDYNRVSEYSISKKLCITQQRVKSLLDLGVNISSIVANVSSIISPSNTIFNSLQLLVGGKI